MNDSGSRPIRAFVAIDLPSQIHADISRIIELINHQNITRLRTIKPGSAHITIEFIGSMQSARIPCLTKAIEGTVAGMKQFNVSIDNFRLHPSLSDPRFAYFEVGRSKQLLELKLAVSNACKQFGVKADSLSWFPHVTMARIPRTKTRSERRYMGERLKSIPDFCKTVLVSQFSIMSSDLGKSGPTYNILKRIHLFPKRSI
jgi:2'-5' RNA ligase